MLSEDNHIKRGKRHRLERERPKPTKKGQEILLRHEKKEWAEEREGHKA